MKRETELTDTFCGQANYSWVDRAEFTAPESISDLAIVRRGKSAAGLTGVRGRTFASLVMTYGFLSYEESVSMREWTVECGSALADDVLAFLGY